VLFSTLEPSTLPVVVAQPDERHANRTASVLEWYDRHRAYYNIWFKRKSSENIHKKNKNYYRSKIDVFVNFTKRCM